MLNSGLSNQSWSRIPFCQHAWACWGHLKRCTWYATRIMLVVHVSWCPVFLRYVLSAQVNGQHGYLGFSFRLYNRIHPTCITKPWLPMTLAKANCLERRWLLQHCYSVSGNKEFALLLWVAASSQVIFTLWNFHTWTKKLDFLTHFAFVITGCWFLLFLFSFMY